MFVNYKNVCKKVWKCLQKLKSENFAIFAKGDMDRNTDINMDWQGHGQGHGHGHGHGHGQGHGHGYRHN